MVHLHYREPNTGMAYCKLTLNTHGQNWPAIAIAADYSMWATALDVPYSAHLAMRKMMQAGSISL